MTIYQQSFIKPLSFIASAPSNSLDSLCTTDISSSSCYHNTSTDCEESLSLLSLPSDEDEEQDWKEFGYLLDNQSNALPSFKGQSFSRSNSMPNPKLRKEMEQNDISSMEVEMCSTRASSTSQSCCLEEENKPEEEPIAKRTRNSLSKRETLSQGLDRLSNIPKEDMILNFLCSSQQKPKKEKPLDCVRWHNVCRPWWHNKIFYQQENNTEEDPWEFKSEEEENSFQAVRKPKEFTDEMCDPRLISLGGGSTTEKEKDSSSSDKVLTTRNCAQESDLRIEGMQESDVPITTKPIEVRKTKRRHFTTEKTEVEDSLTKGSPKKRTRQNSATKKTENKAPSKKSLGSKRQQKVIQDEAEDENMEKACLCGVVCRPSDLKKCSLMCHKCKSNFHVKCIGLTEKKARKLSTWMCPECEAEKKSEELYCICRQPYDETKFYVGCDGGSDGICHGDGNGWFHPQCIGTTQEEISKYDEFLCPMCRESASSE